MAKSTIMMPFFFTIAAQQDDADQGHHRQIEMEYQQHEQRADARRRQRWRRIVSG